MADALLPFLKDRPMVLHRYPRGIDQPDFYQKDNPQERPAWVESVEIYSESNDENIDYLLCQNAATLAYLVNLGCQEMNPWTSRTGSIDQPDWMIFDLDPVDIEFARVVEVARTIHAILEGAGIPSYCKTSGKRGLHVAVPMGARYSNDTVRQLSESIAALVHGELPKITSLERSPSRRRKKVYIDYLQNGFGKTLAAPYSLRPIAWGGVSTPLRWDEVTPDLDPRDFTCRNIGARLREAGDLWKPVWTESVDLEGLLGKQ